MTGVTVKESLTVGGSGGDSPSLRDALEYELNMIESSIEAFENEAEALKALIDWHVNVVINPKANGGWQLVPREPTDEMLKEIQLLEGFTGKALETRYKAMLAAAPKYMEEK